MCAYTQPACHGPAQFGGLTRPHPAAVPIVAEQKRHSGQTQDPAVLQTRSPRQRRQGNACTHTPTRRLLEGKASPHVCVCEGIPVQACCSSHAAGVRPCRCIGATPPSRKRRAPLASVAGGEAAQNLHSRTRTSISSVNIVPPHLEKSPRDLQGRYRCLARPIFRRQDGARLRLRLRALPAPPPVQPALSPHGLCPAGRACPPARFLSFSWPRIPKSSLAWLPRPLGGRRAGNQRSGGGASRFGGTIKELRSERGQDDRRCWNFLSAA